MNLLALLLEQARARPEAPAIIETRRGRERAVTFAELDVASRQAAAMLRAVGLRTGDAAVLLQPMSIELYVALLALFRLGMVAVLFDPAAGAAHIDACCRTAAPRVFIGSDRAHLLRLVAPALRAIPLRYGIGWPMPGARRWQNYARHAPLDELFPATDDSPALLTFTSGSTGAPKAALRTHGFLIAQHHALAANLRLQPGEVDLTTLPAFALANLGAGVTTLIPDANLRHPGFIAPGPVLAQIAAHQPTRTAASPAFMERLADAGVPLQSFTQIYVGGAPVFPHVIRRLAQTAPYADIISVYGSTEAEPIAHLCHRDISDADYAAMLAGRGLLAGPPVAEIRLAILRQQWGTPIGTLTAAEFRALQAAPGEVGEIVVCGAHVLPGYLHGVGDEETKFTADGARWHRTGDAGYLDDRGRLWLMGRCGARIEDARGVLYPFALECAAAAAPGVRRAAVVAYRGRRLLVLELQPNASPEVAQAFQRDGLIDDFRILSRIPVDRRHNAKIDYPALRALLDNAR